MRLLNFAEKVFNPASIAIQLLFQSQRLQLQNALSFNFIFTVSVASLSRDVLLCFKSFTLNIMNTINTNMVLISRYIVVIFA